jgi:hypothetical protein
VGEADAGALELEAGEGKMGVDVVFAGEVEAGRGAAVGDGRAVGVVVAVAAGDPVGLDGPVAGGADEPAAGEAARKAGVEAEDEAEEVGAAFAEFGDHLVVPDGVEAEAFADGGGVPRGVVGVVAGEGVDGDEVGADVVVPVDAVEGLVEVPDEMDEEAEGIEAVGAAAPGVGEDGGEAGDLGGDVVVAGDGVPEDEGGAFAVGGVGVEIDEMPGLIVGILAFDLGVAADEVGPGADGEVGQGVGGDELVGGGAGGRGEVAAGELDDGLVAVGGEGVGGGGEQKDERGEDG